MRSNNDDIPEIKGVVSVYREKRKKSILKEIADPDDELIESGGVFIYVLSIYFSNVLESFYIGYLV